MRGGKGERMWEEEDEEKVKGEKKIKDHLR